MNYGLYLSASGVLTNSYRQDVLANNLANVNTVGFKPDLATIAQRPAEAVEDLTPPGTAHALLDRLGGGVYAGRQAIDFKAGPVQQTGRDLDVALTDDRSFLAVRHVDTRTGQASVHLTRDGRLAVNGQGQLVTTSGHALLDVNDQPIRVAPDAQVAITADGRVQQNGGEVARLQVASVQDTGSLQKAGANLFAFKGPDTRTPNEQPSLRVGALEGSGTDAIKTLVQIMNTTKAATANANFIKYHDTLMDHAINTLGRVA